MKKILFIVLCLFCLTGCSIEIIDEKEDRDEAIQECKDNGGTPYVENYNDSVLRPIVHCIFEGDKNE